MPTPRHLHRSSTRVLSVATLLIGIVLVTQTVIAGGGPLSVRFLLGVLFIAVSTGRLYLLSRLR